MKKFRASDTYWTLTLIALTVGTTRQNGHTEERHLIRVPGHRTCGGNSYVGLTYYTKFFYTNCSLNTYFQQKIRLFFLILFDVFFNYRVCNTIQDRNSKIMGFLREKFLFQTTHPAEHALLRELWTHITKINQLCVRCNTVCIQSIGVIRAHFLSNTARVLSRQEKIRINIKLHVELDDLYLAVSGLTECVSSEPLVHSVRRYIKSQLSEMLTPITQAQTDFCKLTVTDIDRSLTYSQNKRVSLGKTCHLNSQSQIIKRREAVATVTTATTTTTTPGTPTTTAEALIEVSTNAVSRMTSARSFSLLANHPPISRHGWEQRDRRPQDSLASSSTSPPVPVVVTSEPHPPPPPPPPPSPSTVHASEGTQEVDGTPSINCNFTRAARSSSSSSAATAAEVVGVNSEHGTGASKPRREQDNSRITIPITSTPILHTDTNSIISFDWSLEIDPIDSNSYNTEITPENRNVALLSPTDLLYGESRPSCTLPPKKKQHYRPAEVSDIESSDDDSSSRRKKKIKKDSRTQGENSFASPGTDNTSSENIVFTNSAPLYNSPATTTSSSFCSI